GAGPCAPLAAGLCPPGPAAGDRRPALLRRPDGGPDRRRARVRTGNREVAGVGGDEGASSGPGRRRRRGGGGVMNLDEQLRAALDLEAEMCAAPPPDLEGRIAGGRTRRRRRNAALFGGGVLAVVLAGGAVY